MDNETQRRQAISRNLRILMQLTDVGVARIADFLWLQKDLARAKINGLVAITDVELNSLAELFDTTPESFLLEPEGGFAMPKNPTPSPSLHIEL